MDCDKLIERLRNWDGVKPDREIGYAIDGLKALQAENAQLRHRLSEAVSACSRIAEWARNTGHDYAEGIAKEFMEDGAMSTEYIPKSLALDIIARLCTDYSAAYAEISALRGITIEEEANDVSQ